MLGEITNACPRFHVIGAGRGGTSLLASLLNMHPSIDMGFELFAQDILMDSEAICDIADPLQQRFSRYLAACSAVASDSAALGRLWGNKITTEQIFSAIILSDYSIHETDPLERVFNQILDNQLIVFILRDGRSCVSSKMSRAGLPLEEACDRWLFSVRCWQFLEQRSFPTWIIRFEDLIRNPIQVLEGICNQLDVPYDPIMLTGTSSDHLLPEYRQNGFDLTRLQEITLPADGLERIRSALLLAGYGV